MGLMYLDYCFTEIARSAEVYEWCKENLGLERVRWRSSVHIFGQGPDDYGPECMLIEIKDITDAMAYRLRWE